MISRAREVETLLLTMFAAVPLYFTGAIHTVPLLLFHALMLGIVVRVASGRDPELIPEGLMRALAIAYVVFYVVDAAVISRSAISASTHLVLFIATYQPIESVRKNNYAQRLLTTALIFIASIATSTHITIVVFVMAFAFLMFRQLMFVSHLDTVQSIGHEYTLAPMSRAATFYLAAAVVVGALLFPLLPRLRNPVVPGFTAGLTNATTGLSESIDFTRNRTSSLDPTVVARVWMGQQAIPFFTPVRLRAAVYDAYQENKWLQTRDGFREMRPRQGVFQLARPAGFQRSAVVQQKLIRSSRLFLPAGTFAVAGLPQLYEGPTRDAYMTLQGRGDVVKYEVAMARGIKPLRPPRVSVLHYPVSPAVAALASHIVGDERRADRRAAMVERYLSTTYQYVQHPEQIGSRPMTTDEFLLHVRRGHCEYFAAGMVALMSALDVPARIVGGFYGGRMNPLTGYLVLRREDAHAWVEVWDGEKWTTYDPTPAALRPGDAGGGLLTRYASALGDSVNYFWDRYVLTFGLGDQINLAADAIATARDIVATTGRSAAGAARAATSSAALSVYGAILAVVFGALLIAGRRRSLFVLISSRMRQLGIDVGAATTIEEALAVLRARRPDLAADFQEVVRAYEQEEFSPHHDRERVRAIRRKLAEMRG